VFSLALEMGRTVEELLDPISSTELLQWMSFLAVRAEKEAEARRNAQDGFDDDDTTEWGDGDD
jgi:hypothetical protein